MCAQLVWSTVCVGNVGGRGYFGASPQLIGTTPSHTHVLTRTSSRSRSPEGHVPTLKLFASLEMETSLIGRAQNLERSGTQDKRYLGRHGSDSPSLPRLRALVRIARPARIPFAYQAPPEGQLGLPCPDFQRIG